VELFFESNFKLDWFVQEEASHTHKTLRKMIMAGRALYLASVHVDY
jgi:hypothetical protein